MIKEKYQSVLDLGEKLGVQDGDVQVENNQLKIWGTTNTPYEKNLIWDEIKRIGGENPTDILADIKVKDSSIFARHTVKSGDTLSKIAKHYLGNAMKYPAIFDANKDILTSPDVIHPGQNLVIPNL